MKTINKYSNRKLYDTTTSGYLSLMDVADMIQNGTEIELNDAANKTSVHDLACDAVCKQIRGRVPFSVLKHLLDNYQSAPLLSKPALFIPQHQTEPRISRPPIVRQPETTVNLPGGILA